MTGSSGPILALDTSTRFGSVAVGSGTSLLAEIVLGSATGHSAALVPAIDAALRWTGLVPRDLAAVAVAGGPGSFTGVRVAAATAKGIVHALDVPLFAFSSLLVAAAGLAELGRPVCALFDARRGDVFAACYGFRDEIKTLLAPEAINIDLLTARLAGVPEPVVVGDGAVLHQAQLATIPGASVIADAAGIPRASALLWLVGAVPEHGAVLDPAAWEPEYLRPSGAERIAAGKAR